MTHSNYQPHMNHRTISYEECFSSQEKSLGLVTITPDLSEKLVKNHNKDDNSSNRPICRSALEKYKRDLQSGQWINSLAFTISIGSNGRILDGQHRLIMCSETGIPLTVHLLVGVKPEAMIQIDGGKPRTPIARRMIAGDPMTKSQLKITCAILKYGEKTKTNYVPTDSEIDTTYENFKVGIEKVLEIFDARSEFLDSQIPKQKIPQYVSRVGFFAALALIICENPDRGEEFARILIEQKTNSQKAGCPTRCLAQAFCKLSNENRSQPRVDRSLTLKAFKDYINGETRVNTYAIPHGKKKVSTVETV